MQKTNLGLPREKKRGGINQETGTETHASVCQTENQWEPPVEHRELCSPQYSVVSYVGKEAKNKRIKKV